MSLEKADELLSLTNIRTENQGHIARQILD